MRLLLTAFAAAGALTASPAAAVDYVQCREMLRTKNEMIQKIQSSQRLANRQVAEDACRGAEDFTTCVKKAHAQYQASRKGVPLVFVDSWPLQSKILYDPAAIQWQKSAQKVDSDMKKARCPYQ